MPESMISLAGATDTGATVSNAAAGTDVVAYPCRIHRIRFENIVANPVTVLIYDGAANASDRIYCGKSYVPLVNDADLVEKTRTEIFEPPLEIKTKLVCKASEANACYVVAFGDYTPPFNSST